MTCIEAQLASQNRRARKVDPSHPYLLKLTRTYQFQPSLRTMLVGIAEDGIYVNSSEENNNVKHLHCQIGWFAMGRKKATQN